MKNSAGLLALVLISAAAAYAQRPTTPYPQNTPNPVYGSSQVEDAARRSQDLSRRSDALKLTEKFPVKNPARRKEFRELIKPLYRDSNDEERALMAPAEEDRANFKAFLAGKNTGILRLMMDRGCADNVKVVQASFECARYTMPGAGSAFSFRIGDYRMHHISDINFKNKKFQALGVLTHGIMANLGDVPVESVDLETDGVRYVAKIRPAKDFTQAAEFANRLIKGIRDNGFVYGSVIPVRMNSTYVLRSIAYRGEALRNVGGIVFNEMALDRRRDVIVVFRVVRLSADSGVTIVWKEFRDKKSPLLKAKKK